MTPTREAHIAHRDDRRFRELYRYFQPVFAGAIPCGQQNEPPHSPLPTVETPDLVPSIEDITDSSLAVSLMPPHDICPRLNTILTSFAQLAAFKLNAERAIVWCVFLFLLFLPLDDSC